MEATVLTFEQFSKGKPKTPETVKAYVEYLKENGRLAWARKAK